MPLDDELRRALARTPPPADFDVRVMARLAEDASRSAAARSPRRWLRWAAAAAVVATLLGAAGYREHHVRVEQAARAADELRTALAITSDKLAIVQQRVIEAGQRQF
ncbi:MAG TPA: hypothetical protein VHD57_07075 [Vicinamibacterales bacterium]|jgi:hypothetical protein|nr:hypothetical protein [Vicinamibacterales bacterium]